jgi:hypothetical protein
MTENNTFPKLVSDKDVLDDEEFIAMLSNPENISKDDLFPAETGDRKITLNGWKFDISRTIFPDAKVEEVLKGWRLIGKEIPIDIFSLIFFIRSADDYLRLGLTYYNGYEPDLLELLRLCYWYYKSSQVTNIELAHKRSEICKQLGHKLPNKIRIYFSGDTKDFNKELTKELNIIKTHKLLSGGFYRLRNEFREKVSSYVSEFMIASLAARDNFAVKFAEQVKNKKNFDMFIENIPAEVETILDQIPWAERHEPKLDKEICDSLKRDKITEKIDEALQQNGKIVFLHGTVSSLGWGLSEEVSQSMIDLSFKKAITRAINDVTSGSKIFVPVVIITTCIDYDGQYRISAFYVSYPAKQNGSKLEIIPSKLSIENVYLK